MQLGISMAMPSQLPDVLQLPLGFRTGDRRTRHRLVFEEQAWIERSLREPPEILFLGIRPRQDVGGNELVRSADQPIEGRHFLVPPEHGQELLLELASPVDKASEAILEPMQERRRKRRIEENRLVGDGALGSASSVEHALEIRNVVEVPHLYTVEEGLDLASGKVSISEERNTQPTDARDRPG